MGLDNKKAASGSWKKQPNWGYVLGASILLLMALSVLLIPFVNAQSARSIIITNPDSGESITAGDNVTISWQSDSTVHHFQIWYTTDSSATCSGFSNSFPCPSMQDGWKCIESHPVYGNSYEWETPLTLNSSSARIRVEGHTSGHNIAGNDCSGEFSVLKEVIEKPGKPGPFSIGIVSPYQRYIEWGEPSQTVDFYELYRNDVLVANTSNNYYEDSNIVPGNEYTYIVKALNKGGESETEKITIGTSSLPPGANVKLSTPMNPDVSDIEGAEREFKVSLDKEADKIFWILFTGTLEYEIVKTDSGTSSFYKASKDEGEYALAMVASKDGNNNSVLWFWSVLPLTSGTCKIDVHNVEVDGSRIRAQINNTGELSQEINYTFIVDDEVRKTSTITLSANRGTEVTYDYGFNAGRTEVSVKAETDCGATDSESLEHTILQDQTCSYPFAVEGEDRCDYKDREYQVCQGSNWQTIGTNDGEYCINCGYTCGDGKCNCFEDSQSCYTDCGPEEEGWVDNYKCNGLMLQRQYREDQDLNWVDYKFCAYGCTNGACKSGSSAYDPSECGVFIEGFDYLNQMKKGSTAFAEVVAKNTGSSTRVNASIWLDGRLKAYYTQYLTSGQTLSRTFYYKAPSEGTHLLQALAETTCNVQDSRTASVNVLGTAGAHPIQPIDIYSQSQVTPPSIEETLVNFAPQSLDVEVYRTNVIAVNIQSSKEQAFVIKAEGVPLDWLDYTTPVTVDKEDTYYIYLTPKQLGYYNLTVEAQAVSEGTIFKKKIAVFVTAPLQTGIGFLDSITQTLNSMVEKGFAEPATTTIILVIILIVIVMVGIARLRHDIFA